MYDKVIEDCTNALSIDKNYEKALSRRAKAYENLGQLQEAFEDLTSLCILQKFSSSSMVAADKMVKKIGEKMSADIFKVILNPPPHYVHKYMRKIIINNCAKESKSSSDFSTFCKQLFRGSQQRYRVPQREILRTSQRSSVQVDILIELEVL